MKFWLKNHKKEYYGWTELKKSRRNKRKDYQLKKGSRRKNRMINKSRKLNRTLKKAPKHII